MKRGKQDQEDLVEFIFSAVFPFIFYNLKFFQFLRSFLNPAFFKVCVTVIPMRIETFEFISLFSIRHFVFRNEFLLLKARNVVKIDSQKLSIMFGLSPFCLPTPPEGKFIIFLKWKPSKRCKKNHFSLVCCFKTY